MSRVPWCLMAASVTVVVTAGCTEVRDAGAALPPPPPVVLVRMDDYSFQYEDAIPAGRVVFRTVNVGKVSHNLALLPVSDELPPIDEQLHGHERAFIAPFAGVRARAPGQSASFAVDLVEDQRYAFICTLLTRERESHALKGMNGEFRAGAPRN